MSNFTYHTYILREMYTISKNINCSYENFDANQSCYQESKRYGRYLISESHKYLSLYYVRFT